MMIGIRELEERRNPVSQGQTAFNHQHNHYKTRPNIVKDEI